MVAGSWQLVMSGKVVDAECCVCVVVGGHSVMC